LANWLKFRHGELTQKQSLDPTLDRAWQPVSGIHLESAAILFHMNATT
jgi:hypothetical protein